MAWRRLPGEGDGVDGDGVVVTGWMMMTVLWWWDDVSDACGEDVVAKGMVRCVGSGRSEWSSGVWRRLWIHQSLAGKDGQKIWGRRKN
uniref:Uncharacterized protein n=1 Tax=Tanacetum cinerariifolium TaxID=118510 RepID=A0A699Q5G0_TANCI|nr:hypothetical protein [Tanacetum cinerariifolium]